MIDPYLLGALAGIWLAGVGIYVWGIVLYIRDVRGSGR